MAELQELDLKDYLASSDDEDEDDAEGGDLRASLGLAGSDSDAGSDAESKEAVFGDMETTFNLGAEALTEELANKAKQLKRSEGTKVHALKPKEALTPWETYLERRKSKRKDKR